VAEFSSHMILVVADVITSVTRGEKPSMAKKITGTLTSNEPKFPHIAISLKIEYKPYFLAIFEYSGPI